MSPSQPAPQKPVSIFDYASFGSYLNGYVDARKAVDPHYSFRKLAAETGIKSTSLLSMIASNKRAASEEVLAKLATGMLWRPRELDYARVLVNMTNCSSRERTKHVDMLRQIRIAEGGSPLDDRFIDDLRWHYIVILEMTDLADFIPDPAYIARRTQGRIPLEMATEVLERLQDFGVLSRDAEGRLVRKATRLRSPEGGANAAIQQFHKHMLQLAAKAIDGTPIQRRLVSGTTLTIKADAIEAANQLIQEFTTRLIALTHAEGGDATYHFAVQFFPLTSLSAQDEDENKSQDD